MSKSIENRGGNVYDQSVEKVYEQYRDVIEKWGLVGIFDGRGNKLSIGQVLEPIQKVRMISFGRNGILHREDGPAHIMFWIAGGGIWYEVYFRHGFIYRKHGPQIIQYNHGILEKCFVENDVHREFTVAARRRLHRIGGPARICHLEKKNCPKTIEKFYFIQGVRVGRKFAMNPEYQTLRQINGETNAEVKRLRIEYYGWERYLHDMNADVVDTDVDEVSQTSQSLMHCLDGRFEFNILVCACPSTGRLYSIRLPTEILTCKQAQAWLKGPTHSQARIIGAS